MRRRVVLFALTVFICVLPGMTTAQDPKSVVAAALKAMGAETLRTIHFSGMGSIAGVGQNKNPRVAWPVSRMKSYSRDLDLNAVASHVRLVRVQRGSDQTQDLYIGAGSGWDTQFDFWLTPFGFLKGALESDITVRTETIDEAKYNVVSYSRENKYRLVGYIDEQNMIERVQTWIDNDVLGDMLAEVSYTVYKDFGGLKFPTFVIQKAGGFPVLVLSVTDVRANAPVDIQAPPPPPPVQPVRVETESVLPGIYYLKGGTHHSVGIEFADHIAVVEAPQNEQRSTAVISELKRLVPGKPVRYLINTHHHFDHAGGLRTYVDEGAAIVTHQINEGFYKKAFSASRSLNPDRLERSRKQAVIETVAEKKVLADASRTIELYEIKDNPHNDGMLMVFLPKEKILIEADVYTPNPDAPADAAVNPNTVNLAESLEGLKLDFEKILPLHGPGAASRADLYAAIRKPVPHITQILAVGQPPDGQRGRGGGQAAVQADAAATALLSGVCSGCHGMSRIEEKKADAEEWTATIDRMKARGAELSEDEEHVLVEYLVRTYR